MSLEAAYDTTTSIPIHTWMLALAPQTSRAPQREIDRLDEALLARIAEGDLDAFQRFYERHASRVASYARQLARDSHLAEDVTQEVFTSVWTKAASFRPERGDAAGWLYTLTRNKFIDHWRRTSKAGKSEEIDDRRLPDPEKQESDLQLTLRQALAQVTPDQRQAIEMAYFGGLTYQETAGELELPVGTLKSRIRLGLRAMRSVLEEGYRAAN